MTTVLVVEDDSSLRRALRVTLHARSYEVVEAGSGEEALILARDRSPDLVLLDLTLPGIDGIDALRHLRSESDVPIVVLTVRNARSTKVAALDAGADDYVVKPFDSEELLARIRAALRRRPEPTATTPSITRASATSRSTSDAGSCSGVVCRSASPAPSSASSSCSPSATVASSPTTRCSRRSGARWRTARDDARVFVGQLRNKLGDDAADPHLIVNETGLGYRWIAESS